MEKEFLSKNKKIYVLSKDSNGFHVAKYPVVYLNHEYTYYKGGGARTLLEHVLTEHVLDVLDEKEAERVVGNYCDRNIVTFIRGYWRITDGALSVLKDGKDAIEDHKIMERIYKARSDISLKQAQIRDLYDTISKLETKLETKLKWTGR